MIPITIRERWSVDTFMRTNRYQFLDSDAFYSTSPSDDIHAPILNGIFFAVEYVTAPEPFWRLDKPEETPPERPYLQPDPRKPRKPKPPQDCVHDVVVLTHSGTYSYYRCKKCGRNVGNRYSGECKHDNVEPIAFVDGSVSYRCLQCGNVSDIRHTKPARQKPIKIEAWQQEIIDTMERERTK